MNIIYGSSQNIASHESTGTDSYNNIHGDPRFDRTPEENAVAFYELLQAHAAHMSSKRAMELLASPQG